MLDEQERSYKPANPVDLHHKIHYAAEALLALALAGSVAWLVFSHIPASTVWQ